MIEEALEEFQRRCREESGTGSSRSRINMSMLGQLLASYGIITSRDQLINILSSCTRHRLEEEADNTESNGDEGFERLVTFDDLLTSIPLWKLISVSRGTHTHWVQKLPIGMITIFGSCMFPWRLDTKGYLCSDLRATCFPGCPLLE